MLAGNLHGLLIRLDDRLPRKDVTLIAEFIDANELGLAPSRSPVSTGRQAATARKTTVHYRWVEAVRRTWSSPIRTCSLVLSSKGMVPVCPVSSVHAAIQWLVAVTV